MKPTQLNKLEKDNRFRKKYLPKSFWFRKAAIYPPSLVIFAALFGLVYLLNYDLLISWYALPFALMLLLGAVWLKSVKRYILNELFSKDGSFLITWAKVAYTDNNGKGWAVFTTTDRRHDKYYPETIRKELVNENFFGSGEFSEMKKQAKNGVIPLTKGRGAYLKAFKKHEIKRHNANWTEEDVFPVLFIDEDNITLIKSKDTAI